MNFWKQQRAKMGKTQQDIAAAVGRTTPMVSAWERDVCVPPIALTDLLARLYGITREQVRLEIGKQAYRLRGHRSKRPTTKTKAAARPAVVRA